MLSYQLSRLHKSINFFSSLLPNLRSASIKHKIRENIFFFGSTLDSIANLLASDKLFTHHLMSRMVPSPWCVCRYAFILSLHEIRNQNIAVFIGSIGKINHNSRFHSFPFFHLAYSLTHSHSRLAWTGVNQPQVAQDAKGIE